MFPSIEAAVASSTTRSASSPITCNVTAHRPLMRNSNRSMYIVAKSKSSGKSKTGGNKTTKTPGSKKKKAPMRNITLAK